MFEEGGVMGGIKENAEFREQREGRTEREEKRRINRKTGAFT